MGDQTKINKRKLKSILQSAGGIVEENGKNLLVGFESPVEILDGGNRLKVNETNKINIGKWGFRADDGFPEENEGRICLSQKIFSLPLPVEC